MSIKPSLPGTVSSIQRVIIIAEKEVAYDSPDYIMPWGTKQDNSLNYRFNEKLYALYSEKIEGIKVLDLGCSGGGFVKSCHDDGHLAVGLEGNDYSQKRCRCEWGTIPDFLFTCDITAKFEVFMEKKNCMEPLKFDVITAWEVLEHIMENDLPMVVDNISRHLESNGLWIVSISPNEEIIEGIRLHQTVKHKEWWIELFDSLGFTHDEDYVRWFNTQFIRGPKYNAPGSFHLVLRKKDAIAKPNIPKYKLSGRLYDAWLGSPYQRFVKRLFVGP